MQKSNPLHNDDRDIDLNNVKLQFAIKYFLKILRIILMILNVSYFTGIIWILYCDIVEQIFYPHQEEPDEDDHLRFLGEDEMRDYGHENNFLDHFEIYEYSQVKQMLIPMYYAFTSLSTVGFGDFHPQNNGERILCSIILLFGVMIFSYVMGVFIEMISKFETFNTDLAAEDELSKFF